MIDNVQNLVSKKTIAFGAHCLYYKQSFQHRIELVFKKVSEVFMKMCVALNDILCAIRKREIIHRREKIQNYHATQS